MTDQYNPAVFITAINSLNRETRKNLKFTFIGSLSLGLQSQFEELNIHFSYVPTVPHSMINKYQCEADLLLLVIPDTPNNLGILTGKLFEYLGSQNPILNIGPRKGDAAEIIEHCNAGKTYERWEQKKITEYLSNLINNKRQGSKNDSKTKKYSRKVQAQQILEII